MHAISSLMHGIPIALMECFLELHIALTGTLYTFILDHFLFFSHDFGNGNFLSFKSKAVCGFLADEADLCFRVKKHIITFFLYFQDQRYLQQLLEALIHDSSTMMQHQRSHYCSYVASGGGMQCIGFRSPILCIAFFFYNVFACVLFQLFSSS